MKMLSYHAISARQAQMADALHQRMNPRAPTTEGALTYGAMSLLEMAREYLEMHGVSTRGMARFELATAALQTRTVGMQTTGDFGSILANVANKRLRSAYDEGAPSYTFWARRAPDAPDFRELKVVQLSAAPALLRTDEHGEFQYGAMTDGAETYSVITYGRIVSLSRQALINDDLRSFERLLLAFGASSRRLENRLVYSQLTENGAMADGGALFNSTATATLGGHANLASGGASALQASSLSAGRAAMRLQKGVQAEVLNLAPAYLLVPASLEQTAYQLTSNQYTPASVGEINEFRAGGRTSLVPVVEPLLDISSSTAWYLAASSGQVDTVEYCYLAGSDGPVVDSRRDFASDGFSFRCRLDFATKAIDFRGLYKSAGA
jgi:hypothetical protein